MRMLALLLILSQRLPAEIVDRAAIAIGHQVITESQIDEELRVTALLNHLPVSRTSEVRRNSAERLIEQFLIATENEVSHYPGPNQQAIDAYVTLVEKDFGDTGRLRQALNQYRLTYETLRAHLTLQLTILRFIEFRFQPGSTDAGSEKERRTDQILVAWLRQARGRFNIRYLDASLR